MNAFTPVTAALPGSGAPTRPPPSAHRLQRLPRRCRCRHRHRMTTPTPRHPSRCLACTPCTAPSRTARSHAPSRPGSREVGGGRCSSASRRSPGRAASSARCSAGYASGREPVARKSKRRAESPACGGRWLLGGCCGWRSVRTGSRSASIQPPACSPPSLATVSSPSRMVLSKTQPSPSPRQAGARSGRHTRTARRCRRRTGRARSCSCLGGQRPAVARAPCRRRGGRTAGPA